MRLVHGLIQYQHFRGDGIVASKLPATTQLPGLFAPEKSIGWREHQRKY